MTAEAKRVDLAGLRKACSVCSLRELCLPVGLAGQAIERLEGLVETLGPLHMGDRLFDKGEPFQALYAVRSGYLKTYAYNEDGEEQVFGFHLPGELVGLDAIYPDVHQCTAVALDTAMVCRLPFNDLSSICHAVPELQRQLLRLMSRDLAAAHSLSESHTVEADVAAFLLGFGERLARLGFSPRRFILPMTRQDIANYLRLAPETVTRVITRFGQRRWIAVDRREVEILDAGALEALCPGERRL